MRAVQKRDGPFHNLCRMSNLGYETFTPSSMAVLKGAVDIPSRHRRAHLEYDPPKLLGLALKMAEIAKRNWKGAMDDCPEVVVLRLLLVAWGPIKARGVLESLRSDTSGLMELVDETQISSLSIYF